MMKRTVQYTLLATAFLLSCHAMADSPETYTLTTGKMTMTINAEKGARIISMKYGDQEVISQSARPESFGSTFWTSPQKEWNWPPVPEYDKMSYSVEQREGQLVMTSGVSDRLKYRIEKAFSVDDASHAFVITYSIINESDEERKVAPWEITRVPNGGLFFFDAPVGEITPSGLMDFRSVEGVAWYEADEANMNRKINADGKGWLAYASNGLLLVKQFEDLDSSQPAPGEAEIQVYVNRGKSYIELESQGAYSTLQPGERLSWTVRWMLAPCDSEVLPCKALVEQVHQLLSSR
ncbi:MAG: hypothetical protein IKH26_01745 [Bacteroidaceae bacterium]|nr:hypothetical protein [Bacteroidaceae bacterium]